MATAADDEGALEESAEAAGEGVLRLTWLWIYLLAFALVTVLTAFLGCLAVHEAEVEEPAADEGASDQEEPVPEVGVKRHPLMHIAVRTVHRTFQAGIDTGRFGMVARTQQS